MGVSVEPVELSELLYEVMRLKERQKAIESILKEKYARILELMEENGLQRFSSIYNEETVQATWYRKQAWTWKDISGLLSEIKDPLALCEVLLFNASVTKKLAAAFQAAGVDGDHIQETWSKKVLQVRGEIDENGVQAASKEFYEIVANSAQVVKKAFGQRMPEPVFPQEKETEEDVS